MIRSDPRSTRRRPPAAARVLATTTGVQATVTLASLTLAGIAPKVALGLDIPASYIGYHVSLAYAALMLTSLFVGRSVKRWGACRLSQVGLVFAALGSLATTVPFVPVVATGSLLIGLGLALPNPAASHLLVRFTNARRRNFIFSVKQTGVPLGGLVAGLMGPPIALAWGWQWAPVIVASFAILFALLLQPVRASWDDDRDRGAGLAVNPLPDLKLVLARPSFRWLAVAGASFGFVQLCFVAFVVTLLVAEVGFDLLVAGLTLSIVQASGAVGRLAWGWAADRIGDGLTVLVILGVWVTVGTLATAALAPDWPVPAVQIVAALFGFAAMGWNGVFLAEVARLSKPGTVGVTTGAFVAVFSVGAVTGPALFAFVTEQIGSYTTGFALLSVIACATALAAVIARRSARAEASDEPSRGA